MIEHLARDMRAAVEHLDVPPGDVDAVVRRAGRRSQRRRRALTIMVTLFGAAAVTLGVGVYGISRPETQLTARAPGSGLEPGMKERVEAVARADHTFNRIDRSAVKGVLWADIQPIVEREIYPHGNAPPAQHDPSDRFWVAVVSGDSGPPKAAGASESHTDVFRWRVSTYDVETGASVLSYGLSDGTTWPAWFDGLTDRDDGSWHPTRQPTTRTAP